MLRKFAPFLVAFSMLAVAGCGSGGDSNPNTFNDYTITLNQSQDVNQVTLFHRDLSQNGSPLVAVFTQQYFNQDPIIIHIQLLEGESYRIETYTTDPNSSALVPLSEEDFTASSNGVLDYSGQPINRSQQGVHSLVLSVPQMARASASPVTSTSKANL